MLTVFALAAALCLQVFVKADEMAVRTRRQDRAVLIAQNAAEMLKAGADPADIPGEADYPMEIRMLETDIPGLAMAEITVGHTDEAQPLFTVETGWQEVAP